MKHVFIAPGQRFIQIQYMEFRRHENLELVLLDEKVRKMAKAMTLANITSLKAMDWALVNYYEESIGKAVDAKNWEDRICFIVYSRIYESFGEGIVRYLRNKYKGCRVVAYYGDIIAAHRGDVTAAKKIFDAVFTFDIKDADAYTLHWCLEPFSKDILRNKRLRNSEIKWDVTFVGKAKGRYGKIIRLYEKLREAGLTCDFHITGVKPKDRAYAEEIGYAPLDFMDLLGHVSSSRCVAEILQDGAVSPTTRYSEAMLLGKNLLTDCAYFADAANRTSGVFYFERTEDLEKMNVEDFLKCDFSDRRKYADMFSVRRMIDTIDLTLGGKSNDSGIKTQI